MTFKEGEFYGVKNIKSGRKEKVCEFCSKSILVGTAHDVNTFFPDPNATYDDPTIDPATMYRNYPTHKECTEKFHKTFTK